MNNNKANYFKIGLFAVFACFLLVVIVVALGVGKWTREVFYIETYIDESVQGLSVGSPVKHRGVQIGRVDKISFAVNEYIIGPDEPDYAAYSRYVMVVVASEPGNFAAMNESQAKNVIDKMVEQGLRIRLTQQALTGVAYLEADYFDPLRYPVQKMPWESKNVYIPSVQSVLSTFTQTAELAMQQIAKVDFIKLSNDLDNMLVSLNNAVGDAQISRLSEEGLALMSELRQSNAQLKEFLVGATETNKKVQKFMSPADSDADYVSLPQLVNQINHAVSRVENVFTPVSDDYTPTSVPELLSRMDMTVRKVDRLISTQQPEVEERIDSVREMVDNLNELTEDRKRYPKQILFGNPPAKSEVVK